MSEVVDPYKLPEHLTVTGGVRLKRKPDAVCVTAFDEALFPPADATTLDQAGNLWPVIKKTHIIRTDVES